MSIFRPASFRRFLTDITRGPDDLMAIAEATREPLTDQHAEYAHRAHIAKRRRAAHEARMRAGGNQPWWRDGEAS